MALDPYALTTLADVKSHLNIGVGITSEDTKLERMINASSTMIENYLDRKILERTYTEYQDGRGNDRILLNQYPAQKPTELWDDPGSEFTDTNDLINSADYVIQDENVVTLLAGLNFARSNNNIKVVYTAGYTTVPYDIAEACILLVEYQYDMANDRRIGKQSKSKNSEGTTYVQGIPQFIKDMLDPYIRYDFGNVPAAVDNR